MRRVLFLTLIINYLIVVKCGKTRIKTVGKATFHLKRLKERNVFPESITVMEGENVFVHLTKVPQEITECLVILPDSEKSIALSQLFQDDRISYWSLNGKSNECGLKIKNVTKFDHGRYRLKAIGPDNDVIQGVTTVSVVDLHSLPDRFLLNEDTGSVTVSVIGSNVAEYCEVNIPNRGKTLTDNCHVDLPEVAKSYFGNWTTKAGLRGKMREVHVESKAVIYGHLFYADVRELDTDKVALICNLRNASVESEIVFCRFVHPSGIEAFHLKEGIGNDDYRYYGNGLKKGECGVVISKVKTSDEGNWKCSLGVRNTKTGGLEVMESIVMLLKDKNDSRTVTKSEEIVVEHGSYLSVNCKANFRLKYCWFVHPNGTVFNPTPGDENMSDRNYWFTPGMNLLLGQCGITVKEAQYEDAGEWTCNLGQMDFNGLDVVAKVQVRISNSSLAAERKEVEGEIGRSVTLSCKSVALDKALDYCRFTLPSGSGINIDEYVTQERSIENQYYYNGTSLLHGDCQITIKTIHEAHMGLWTCTALNKLKIGSDTIVLKEIKGGKISLAAISYIVCIAIVVLFALGFAVRYVTKKYGEYSPNAQAEAASSDVQQEELELGDL